jgi:hypothetical protein
MLKSVFKSCVQSRTKYLFLKPISRGVVNIFDNPRATFRDLMIGSDTKQYVDKSLWLTELFSDPITSDCPTVIINRPPGFGKRINFDMIENFMSLPIDKDGKLAALNPNTELFNNLDVSKISDFVEKYHGKHPVVRVDLSVLNGTSFAEIETQFSRLVVKLFQKHSYLLQSTSIEPKMIAQFKKCLKGEFSPSNNIERNYRRRGDPAYHKADCTLGEYLQESVMF